MRNFNFLILLALLLFSSSSYAQCFSNKGIMNAPCQSLTIVMPPAFDVSLGLSNAHIFKLDVNYITKNEIVYGGSIGIRPDKVNRLGINQEDANINAFLGYNFVGCIIVGVTAGVTHFSNYTIVKDKEIKATGTKSNIGMSMKIITTYTSFPITIGGYANNSEIGVTIGTIF